MNSELRNRIIGNCKSGSDLSCFSIEELTEFAQEYANKLALGVMMDDDLVYAGALVAAELCNVQQTRSK